MVWEGDRRAQERMGTLYRAIELTRHGAMLQRREAINMPREAAGLGLAEAGAWAMGQANNNRVKEQVEEKLRQAELMDRSGAMLDRSAKDLEARVQQVQIRLDRFDQMRREQQRQVAELRQALEGAKQEVAERRQEAYGLEALLEALRRREARCNRNNDQHDTKALKGEVTTDYGDHDSSGSIYDDYNTSGAKSKKEGEGATGDGAREVTTDHDDYDASGASSNKEGEGDTGDGGKRREDDGSKDVPP